MGAGQVRRPGGKRGERTAAGPRRHTRSGRSSGPSVSASRPLGRILDDDDKNIQILTTQQYHILRAIECVQAGCNCGRSRHGKTVLAMEEVRRCALNGFRTLYTCFNPPLAEEIKRRTQFVTNLEIATFHDLCLRIVSAAGIPIPVGLSESILFRDTYPNLLFEALCDNPFEVMVR